MTRFVWCLRIGLVLFIISNFGCGTTINRENISQYIGYECKVDDKEDKSLLFDNLQNLINSKFESLESYFIADPYHDYQLPGIYSKVNINPAGISFNFRRYILLSSDTQMMPKMTRITDKYAYQLDGKTVPFNEITKIKHLHDYATMGGKGMERINLIYLVTPYDGFFHPYPDLQIRIKDDKIANEALCTLVKLCEKCD